MKRMIKEETGRKGTPVNRATGPSSARQCTGLGSPKRRGCRLKRYCVDDGSATEGTFIYQFRKGFHQNCFLPNLAVSTTVYPTIDPLTHFVG